MATIAEYLRKILEARYGRDVRGSIHDAISAINDEAEEAVNNSTASAQSAQLSAESANKASSDVAKIKTDIYDTAIPAINQAVSDSQAAQMAAETAREGAETARTDTEALEAQCKIYKDKCENATSGITGGLIPQGTTEYANLPSLEDASVGWLFYISDDFVTTSEFIEGEGFYYPPGTNAYVISVDGTKYWDCMGGEMSGYLMKNDFDSTLADAKPEFEEATELKVSSGITSVKNLFANVAKIIKVLGSTDLSKVGDDISSIIKGLSDKIGSTDISGVGDGSVTGAVSVLNSNLNNVKLYPINVLIGPLSANTDITVATIDVPNLQILYSAILRFNGYILPISNIFGDDYVIGVRVISSGTTVKIIMRSSANWTLKYSLCGVIFYR